MFRIDLREIREETSVESKRLDQETKRNAMEAKNNQNCLIFIMDEVTIYIGETLGLSSKGNGTSLSMCSQGQKVTHAFGFTACPRAG